MFELIGRIGVYGAIVTGAALSAMTLWTIAAMLLAPDAATCAPLGGSC